jgi:hypothetical protein
MSLYFDADSSVNGNSSKRSFNLVKCIKNCILVVLICTFFAIGFAFSWVNYNKSNQDKFYEKRDRIANQLKIKITNLRSENEAFSEENMPFIVFSKIHNFDIKYVSSSQSEPIPVDIEAVAQTKISASDKIRDTPIPVEKDVAKTEPKVQKKQLDLNEQFAQAVEATNSGDLNFDTDLSETNQNDQLSASQITDAVPLQDLPSKFINRVPSFMYNAHNYSTDPSKRSISLDGHVVKEGGSFKNLTIIEIKPNYVIMRIGGQSFSQRAMEDFSR